MNTEASGSEGPDQNEQELHKEQNGSGASPASTSTGQGAASALARFKSLREQRSRHSPADGSQGRDR